MAGNIYSIERHDYCGCGWFRMQKCAEVVVVAQTVYVQKGTRLTSGYFTSIEMPPC